MCALVSAGFRTKLMVPDLQEIDFLKWDCCRGCHGAAAGEGTTWEQVEKIKLNKTQGMENDQDPTAYIKEKPYYVVI